MFESAKFRTRLIISIYSLTGIRKSELIDLKLKHLQNIASHNLYKFTIYENTKEEYFTLCTPECASMIDEHITEKECVGKDYR